MHREAGCAYRISNPGILMVQSAQDRMADNASGCLGGERDIGASLFNDKWVRVPWRSPNTTI